MPVSEIAAQDLVKVGMAIYRVAAHDEARDLMRTQLDRGQKRLGRPCSRVGCLGSPKHAGQPGSGSALEQRTPVEGSARDARLRSGLCHECLLSRARVSFQALQSVLDTLQPLQDLIELVAAGRGHWGSGSSLLMAANYSFTTTRQ